MRCLLAFLVLSILLVGCGTHRQKQATADALAGIDAAGQMVEAGAPAASIKAVLAGARLHILDVIQVAPDELLAPKMTAPTIVAEPDAYHKAAPPEPAPTPGWLLAASSIAAAVTALYLGKTLKPGKYLTAIPIVGPALSLAIGPVIDSLWETFATSRQHATEANASSSASAQSALIPITKKIKA